MLVPVSGCVWVCAGVCVRARVCEHGGGSGRQLTDLLVTWGDRDKEEKCAVSEGEGSRHRGRSVARLWGEREAQSHLQRAVLGQRGTESSDTMEQEN